MRLYVPDVKKALDAEQPKEDAAHALQGNPPVNYVIRRALTKERFWRRTLRLWRRSGLSVRAFCREHHLAEPNFYAWRRTLAQRDAEPVTFVPVEVLPEAPPLPPAASTAAGLELLLPGGRVLRLGPTFDAPTL